MLMIAVAAAALVWFALVVLAPVLPPFAAAMVYAAGGFVCHQLPDRSFHWHGAQLAVCARCTGIYFGACAAAILAPLPASSFRSWVESRTRAGALLGAAAVPMAVTVAVEWAGWWQPAGVTRALTGVLLGVAGAIVVVTGLKYSECLPRAADEQGRPRPLQPRTPI